MDTKTTLSEELKTQVKQYADALGVIREFLGKDQIEVLEDALKRLETLQVNIAVFGETNSGKSALLHSLFGFDNDKPEEWLFKVDDMINCWSDSIELTNGKIWSQQGDLVVTLYDTPGIAGDIESHIDIALRIVDRADIVLYVVFEPIKNELQVPIMKRIIESGKPVIVVINKVDIRRRSEIAAIRTDLMNKFRLQADQIVESAGYPREGAPQIAQLVERVLGLINRHQSDLIDSTVQSKLNMGVEDAKRILIERVEIEEKRLEKQRKDELIRYEEQKKERMVLNHLIIHGSASGAAAATGLLAQVPGGNEAALTAITAAMIGMLCANYNKLSRNLVLTYLGILSGALLGKTAASYAWRYFPGIGNIIEGVVTFALHEGQGWLIVVLLEKGLYTATEINATGIDNLKKEAADMKKQAKAIESSMDASKVAELKARMAALKETAKSVQPG